MCLCWQEGGDLSGARVDEQQLKGVCLVGPVVIPEISQPNGNTGVDTLAMHSMEHAGSICTTGDSTSVELSLIRGTGELCTVLPKQHCCHEHLHASGVSRGSSKSSLSSVMALSVAPAAACWSACSYAATCGHNPWARLSAEMMCRLRGSRHTPPGATQRCAASHDP